MRNLAAQPGNRVSGLPEFHRLAYREVKSPNLFDVLKDNNWPEELRGYRQAIGDGAGVPLWLVIADDLPLVDECNRAVGTATKQLVRHNDAPISEAVK